MSDEEGEEFVPKHVAVAGGGIAGMTAATELLYMGHHVTMYEERANLGGKATSHFDDNGYFREHSHRLFLSWYTSLHRIWRKIPLPSAEQSSDKKKQLDEEEEETKEDTVLRVKAEKPKFVIDTLEPLISVNFYNPTKRRNVTMPLQINRCCAFLTRNWKLFKVFRLYEVSYKDIMYTVWRVLLYITSSNERILHYYGNKSWSEFMRFNSGKMAKKSKYNIALASVVGSIAAAGPDAHVNVGMQVMSTKIFATVSPFCPKKYGVKTLFYQTDRDLESAIWIPWRNYLLSKYKDRFTICLNKKVVGIHKTDVKSKTKKKNQMKVTSLELEDRSTSQMEKRTCDYLVLATDLRTGKKLCPEIFSTKDNKDQIIEQWSHGFQFQIKSMKEFEKFNLPLHSGILTNSKWYLSWTVYDELVTMPSTLEAVFSVTVSRLGDDFKEKTPRQVEQEILIQFGFLKRGKGLDDPDEQERFNKIFFRTKTKISTQPRYMMIGPGMTWKSGVWKLDFFIDVLRPGNYIPSFSDKLTNVVAVGDIVRNKFMEVPTMEKACETVYTVLDKMYDDLDSERERKYLPESQVFPKLPLDSLRRLDRQCPKLGGQNCSACILLSIFAFITMIFLILFLPLWFLT